MKRKFALIQEQVEEMSEDLYDNECYEEYTTYQNISYLDENYKKIFIFDCLETFENEGYLEYVNHLNKLVEFS